MLHQSEEVPYSNPPSSNAKENAATQVEKLGSSFNSTTSLVFN
jgi:hypothetical protein